MGIFCVCVSVFFLCWCVFGNRGLKLVEEVEVENLGWVASEIFNILLTTVYPFAKFGFRNLWTLI